MSLLSFIKDAGEKLFKKAEPAASSAAPQPNVAELNAKSGEATSRPTWNSRSRASRTST